MINIKYHLACYKKTLLSLLIIPIGTVFAEPENTSNSLTEEPQKAEKFKLETVTVSAPKDIANRIGSEKLLSVPGAGNDPLQAITSLPGVSFTRAGRNRPAVRGSSPDDNLYLIDFMPVGYVFHSDGSSVITDNNIEQFTLDTAAFAAQYNDATGALIAVDTRAPYNDMPQVVLDLGLLKTGIFIEAPLNAKHSVYFSARRSLIQYYLKALFKGNDDFKFTTFPNYYDYQGKYAYQVNDLESISLNLIGANDEASIFFKEGSDKHKQDPELVGDFGFKRHYHSQSIIWDKFYTSGLTHKIGFSQLLEKFQFQLGVNNKLNANSRSYYAKSQFNYPLNTSHELQWGINLEQNNVHYQSALSVNPSDEFSPPQKLSDSEETINANHNTQINTLSANFGDKIQLFTLFSSTFAVALATDDYSRQTFIEPRIKSRYQLSSTWAITGAYGEHHQYKNFYAYSKGFGNPKLKQEQAQHYELGLENQLNDNWFWKVEVYYKELSKLITARLPSSFYPNLSDADYLQLPRYSNDAKGKAYGAELFINRLNQTNWYGWLSLAYSHSKRTHLLTQKTFRYNTDQPWILNLVANYRLENNWQLGLKWRLQSGQLVTPVIDAKKGLNSQYPDVYTPIYAELNSQRLPFYSKVDVRAQKAFRFQHWQLDMYVDVLNALFTKNVIGYAYEGEDYSIRKEVKDFPTYVAFGLKATF